jgi:endonuclease G
MNLPDRITDATSKRFERIAPLVNRRPALDFIPTVRRDITPERLAAKSRFLGLGGSRPSSAEFERLMGSNDLVDEFYLMRALLVAQPVARISVRSGGDHERGFGTGFMVSPRLLLTNHHVLPRAEDAVNSIAEFNFRDDVAGNPEPSFRHLLRPEQFYFPCKAFDFALVAVDPRPVQDGPPLSRWGWLRLIQESGKARAKDWLTVIQHPGGRRRQFAIRENQCVDDKDPDFLWYLSDTAPGSSGAPVFNDSFQVAALHHSGRARKKKGKYILRNGDRVDSIKDVDDSLIDWIANEGVRVSRICAVVEKEAVEKDGHIEELRAAMAGGDVLSRAFQNPAAAEFMNQNQTNSSTTVGSVVIPITLDLRLTLSGQPLAAGGGAVSVRGGGGGGAGGRIDAGGGALEAYKTPYIEKPYAGRKGFNVDFLGVRTLLPTVLKKAAIAAPMKGTNEVVIPYENFSVVMHKTRRLAVYTAANVDWSSAARMPEPRPSADYTRDGLAGLTESDDEQWINDERLDDQYQVPDFFYKADGGNFDKGHVVRRDDMCWGPSYNLLRRANGDTYHVTNCTPQVKEFNRAPKFQGLWGLLENFIQAQGKTEKYNVFAGPVLADDDRWFDGKEAPGKVLRVQIPRAFWKVVVVAKNGKLQVYGFLLEQDLSAVPPGAEFQPTDKWRHRMISLKDLEAKLKILRFRKALHDADQA